AMDHPDLWPRVVEALRDPEVAASASEALLEAGAPVVPHLAAGLRRHPDDRPFRLAVLRILGLIGGPGIVSPLVPLLDAHDRDERTAALSALVRSGAPEKTREALGNEATRRLERELAQAAEAFVALADLEALPDGRPGAAAEPLRTALAEEVAGARHRIFLLLALAKPGRDVAVAWENYASGSREKRGYALELLDSQLTTEERARIFPLLEDLSLAERIAALPDGPSGRRLPPAERVAGMTRDSGLSPWTRLCACRLAVELQVEAPPLDDDQRRLYERASRLGRVELFRDLPASVLARVVPRLELREVEADRTVIRKGETGDSMYVILEGCVRVHDDGRELAVLGGDNVFGEFTVLQRRPRTATVTTLEPTRLLRFTRHDLQELMQEEVGVARALIRVILRRLRQNREISAAGPAAPRSAPGSRRG
ncbi:MAG: cyclic nucleotide-binding domain-containing protein, partial [Gemmatimonadota bacterium]|nr:cyclic nucleotide-binding domain-containing protein [Gemmatimonadota bacterium]